MPLAVRALACIVTGVAMVLGAPDTGWWWLGFVGFVPWLWAIDGQPWRRALGLGWLAGVVQSVGTAVWMTHLMERFAGLPAPAAWAVHLLFAVAEGAPWAVVSAGLAGLQRRTGRDLLLLAPLAWVAGEALVPQLFPVYSALLWAEHPVWLQAAELGGVTMVGAIQLLCNSAVYLLFRDTRGRPRLDVSLALAFVLGAVPAYGAWRMRVADQLAASSPHVRFGLVQGNHGIREWSRKSTRDGVLWRLQAESMALEAEGAEILVWGENAFPYRKDLGRHDAADFDALDPRRIRVGFTDPLVLGALTNDADRSLYAWNSAVVLAPDGKVGDIYDKNYPLYFGEYAPLVDPAWYLANVKGASHINAGASVRALRVGEWSLGPLICYEDILPRFVRRVVNEGAHVLVNLTSDTWFGRSSEQGQHLDLAVLRGIETRRAVVRTVNAGPSGWIDPAGRIRARTAVTDPDAPDAPTPVADGLVVSVPMIDPDYRTPYVRFGEWFPGLSILTLIGLAARGSRRR